MKESKAVIKALNIIYFEQFKALLREDKKESFKKNVTNTNRKVHHHLLEKILYITILPLIIIEIIIKTLKMLKIKKQEYR